MDNQDVIAISRLMGRRLEILEIPECCIFHVTDNDEVDFGTTQSETVAEVG